MAGRIYKKPFAFAVVATIAILIGTVVTMAYPMLRSDMHPKLEELEPFSPLELAGRDIYQREGCVNCHTQTVRPLKSEVLRYGAYSKAGEFAYDRPFLWGSKRTGPDLARIGGKYPDAWHVRHFENAQAMFPKSNMPAYGWLKAYPLDAAEVKSHMDALSLPYSDDDLKELEGKNELDALIAYVQQIGRAVTKKEREEAAAAMPAVPDDNPLAGKAEAIAKGATIYKEICADCHAENLEGDIAPSLIDKTFLYKEGDVKDALYYRIIAKGTEEGEDWEGRTAEGGMLDYAGELGEEKIWSVIAFIRSKQTAAPAGDVGEGKAPNEGDAAPAEDTPAEGTDAAPEKPAKEDEGAAPARAADRAGEGGPK